MTGKGWGFCLGCVALGAVGAVLLMKNKEKMKPMAAKLVAKSMKLRDKALNCAASTMEHVDDIIAEAKHINEAAPQTES